MLSAIGFVLTIGILVFVHEFGHYCVARFFGVKVEEFSIGFGKELFGITDKRGARWKVCLLPFGGYVKIYGYDCDALEKTTTPADVVDEKVAFFAKSCFARFWIVAAGPLINYLLAIIIFTAFYFHFGKTIIPPVIGEVIQDSPAAKMDLRAGDVIIKVNNKIIDNFGEVQNAVLLYPYQPLDLVIKRQREIIPISITPQILHGKTDDIAQNGGPILGIVAQNQPVIIKMNLFSGAFHAVNVAWDISVMTLKSLGQMIVGKRSLDGIGGPLTIADQSGKSLAHGPLNFTLFIAMLSINLGLLNFLPIPLLDGGQLVLILYEAIIGYPPHQKAKKILLHIGTAIILFLIVISLSNDIRNFK